MQIDGIEWDSLCPPELQGKGWVYKIVPILETPYYSEFKRVIGANNIHAIVETTHINQFTGRIVGISGQYFISPEGVKNAQAYAEKYRRT